MPDELIHALALVKAACARANMNLGLLPAAKAGAIMAAADEVAAGRHPEEFPLSVWQTGSGTQTNMNVNEVIANRAHVLQGGALTDTQKVLHPNDDVNRSQSTNDVYPTAIKLAMVMGVQRLLAEHERLTK